jgi:hypothetical protein
MKAEQNLNTAFTMTEARAFRMLGTHGQSGRLGGKQGYPQRLEIIQENIHRG